MLSETEKEKLRLLIFNELKDDADKFDTDAEIDSELTFEENKNILLDKIELFRTKEFTKLDAKEELIMQRLEQMKPKNNQDFWDTEIDKIKIGVVYGDTGSGKTALVFKLLEKSNKPVYVFKHPNPKLIEAIGYHNMKSESEFSKLRDCLVYIDEPQLHFKKQDKQSNDYFLLLGSMARQYGFSILISTSDTRWVNKGLESYVSHWLIKDLDMCLVKNGSMIKSIIKNVMPLAVNDLNLEVSEYIYYNKKDQFNSGLHTFRKPAYFDDRFSKAFAQKDKLFF